MKKETFIVVIIALCLGFSCINIIKSSIRDLRFLLTMSSETLANAEAIDGEGEGNETQPVIKKYLRYWDRCSYRAKFKLTVNFWPTPGLTYERGQYVEGLEGKVKYLKDGGGQYVDQPNHIKCGDNQKPENEPWLQ